MGGGGAQWGTEGLVAMRRRLAWRDEGDEIAGEFFEMSAPTHLGPRIVRSRSWRCALDIDDLEITPHNKEV